MKGWKTIIFNILMGVMLVVEEQGQLWGLSLSTIGFITVMGNAILRFFTNTPVGKKTVPPGGVPTKDRDPNKD